jgi:hypothetical protein
MKGLGEIKTWAYHERGNKVISKTIKIPKYLFGCENFSSQYCPKCEVYIFKHFYRKNKGIESKKSEDIWKYLEKVINESG